MSRSEVRGVLWPSLPEADAAGRLRTALWNLAPLRSLLVSEDREAISLDQSVDVDVPDMLQAAAAVDDGETRSPDLFAADLLPTWDEEWLMMERERLRQIRLHALEQLSRRFAEAEDYGTALDAALTCLHADPLRESAHRAVIRVHLAEGNMAAAVAQYDRCRAVLESELGLPPTRQLTELMAAGGWRPPAAMHEVDDSRSATPEGMASRPVRR
jgi:DNA-binding SARP family transcriptional activator